MMKKILPVCLLFTLVYGCSGGGGGSSPPPAQPVQQSTSVSGGGVKGPLANAAFALYKFDPTYTNFQAATAASSGRTTSQAKFSINIATADLNPPYILVFTADAQTTDLMTGGAPLITTMKTVVTQAMLDSGANIYATPLTTMAIDVAIENTLSNRAPYTNSADYNNATTVKDKFLAALPIAAQQVKSTLGFGLGQDIDIYTTPPIVDSSTDSDTKLNNTAQYRGAVEALGAVVAQLRTQVSGTIAPVNNDTLVSALVADLADGQIDGVDAYGNTINVLPAEVRTTLENTDPQQLIVPGTTKTVAEMTAQLASETTLTGNTSTSTTSLTNNTITITTEPAQTNPDRDNDGVPNSEDAFPDNAAESLDTDHDGIGNNADNDDDGDGWLDANDDYPLDATKQLNPALDRDNDGQANGVDPCPLDATDSCAGITDSDGDGVPDSSDNCPTVSNPDQIDTDGDTVLGSPTPDTGGDVCDNDDDGDGVPDAQDAFPLDANESLDTDHDGIGNNADTDDDNDGVLDVNEVSAACALLRDCDGDGRMDNNDAFPSDSTEWVDTDNDGIGNNADTDDDGDGVDDTMDAFPLDPTRSSNITDNDADGIDDAVDNCPGLYNPLQSDRDGDNMGDLCDDDDDNDGVLDVDDAFPLNPNESVDTDQDGTGNNADTDDDNDGVLDVNEVSVACSLLKDCDSDGFNDDVDAFPTNPAEHADADSDGVGDNSDNCPATANANQLDTDNDGQGDACDSDDDNDGVADAMDAFPLDPTESVDTDMDGIGNNADTDDDNDGVSDVDEATLGTNPLVKDTDADGTDDGADNCPINANANQLDTDSDGMGDVCDTDDDNDGVADTMDNCPLVSNANQLDANGNGIGDACEAPNSGAFSSAVTTTGHTETIQPETNWCWDPNKDQLNVPQNTYISVNVNMANNSIIIDGNITGTVNADGSYTATRTDTRQESYYDAGTQSQVPFTVYETLTVTGNANAVTATGFTGTFTDTQTDSTTTPTVLNCSQTGTVSGTLTYAPNGTEDYNSVYAIEAELDKWDPTSNSSVTQRQAYTAQFVFDKTNKTVAFYGGDTDTVSSSYDPVSGHFDVTFMDRMVDTYDANGDGYQDLVQHSNALRGVLIAAPGSSTPEMWVDTIDGMDTVYCGDAVTAPPADTSGTPCQTQQNGGGRAYAKMVGTTAYNNVFTNPSTGNTTQDQAFLGLLDPPLMDTSSTSTLYFEAYSGATATGTPLCSVTYADRYQRRSDLPRPDFAAMAMLTSPYGRVNCPLATTDVVVSQQYTLVVRDDAGTPAVTTDDVTVYSTTFSAAATSTPPGVLPDRYSLNINGAMPSQTEASNYIAMPGYFSPKANLNFTWTVPASGVDRYSVRLWGYDPYNTAKPLDNSEYRMTTGTSNCAPSCTASVTMQPNTTEPRALAARLMTRYNDGAGNFAFSQSKFVVFAYGLNGMVNVEMLDPNNAPMIIQLAVQTDDMGNIVNCSAAPVGGDSCVTQTTPNGQTAYGYVDYSTDTVTIFTTSGNLVLVFSDAVNATATLDINSGNARVVTSEMVAKTRIAAGGTPIISTQLYLSNPLPAYSLATLNDLVGGASTLDGVNTSLVMWDNSGANNYYTSVTQFAASDWDGVPATNLSAASFDSKSTTGVQLDNGSYQIALTGGSGYGMPDTAYKVVNTYTDPSSLAPPMRTAMSVDGTAGTGGASGTGTPTTPLAVTSFMGTITWQSTAASTTEWQVIIRGEDVSNVDVPGQDVRTSWMAAGTHPQLSVAVDTPTAGTNTWTWTNPGIPTYPFASTGTAGTSKILLRVRPAGDGPIQGISQAFFVTSTAP